MEATLHRLLRDVPAVFGREAFECFIPLARRDLGVFELSTGNFIFIRSKSIEKLAKLKRTTGVSGMVTVGDYGKVSNAITVPDAEVQPMIRRARETEAAWSQGIQKGSFVRILDGMARGYCGHVIKMRPFTVRIKLLTKTLIVVTPRANLLHLPDVPPHQQLFYFSPTIFPAQY
jgi:hypothetical protein